MGCEFRAGFWVIEEESGAGEARLNAVHLIISAFEPLPHPGSQPNLLPSVLFLPLADTLSCPLDK